ncbi:hypothetical protein AK812_SmicGene35544 [Symbiodinium microadriaticum]|uniref:Uncharacterized protein n=1 Tax=Symbiodinium microadriaticum TaxID=2951 RepID=A0A1Q9CL73_SYMMI|nr:hypothetical protein AK812_SmicGene35544 [Symbiodinium microadriaticum]CAE7863323.1 unnamed protein product [Symbiodinium microadriaticum]
MAVRSHALRWSGGSALPGHTEGDYTVYGDLVAGLDQTPAAAERAGLWHCVRHLRRAKVPAVLYLDNFALVLRLRRGLERGLWSGSNPDMPSRKLPAADSRHTTAVRALNAKADARTGAARILEAGALRDGALIRVDALRRGLEIDRPRAGRPPTGAEAEVEAGAEADAVAVVTRVHAMTPDVAEASTADSMSATWEALHRQSECHWQVPNVHVVVM